MSIRAKLAWTFILLLIFGITAISSYSILFIRDYLLEEGEREIMKDARWLAVTVENLPGDSTFTPRFREAALTAGYEAALYDRDGILFATYPDTNLRDAPAYLADTLQASLENDPAKTVVHSLPESEKLTCFALIPRSVNAARFIRISQYKDQIYAPIKTIRWIIYYGMFISIALVIIVSIWISRYLTKPITQIKNAAQEIARGDVNRQIDLKRGDEFGTLAQSLNQMASRLREDTRQIKQFADKQRQFFADITHEIRNPLHTIAGALEMLEMDDLSEEQRLKYLSNARKQTERISRLFKDLVTLQRYESDEHFLEKKEFDLSAISRHMEEIYGDVANEKGISLRFDSDTCKVVGDPGKIEQVIENLVSNAVKYTNNGHIRLRYAQQDGEVEVCVEDTGIGISDEHLDRLFDRFYRTDKARSRDRGGTGLGLAVVKSILDAHDSRVQVESEVGKGTVFRFTLPAA